MNPEQTEMDICAFLASDDRRPDIYEELKTELCRNRDLRRQLTELADKLVEDHSALGERMSKAKALGRRGVILWLLGDLENAEAAFSEAGSEADVDFEFGWCRVEMGFYDAAIESLQSIAGGDPRHARAQLLIAEADTNAGRSDKSLPALQKIVESSPSPEAWYQFGRACAAEGNQVQAVQAYEKALEMNPDFHKATFRLGYAYVLAGDREAAIGHYSRLAEHTPLYPNALLNLGMLYEDSGQINQAMLCYKRVMKACPNHSRARLFFRDARAASDMFYDPEEQKERSRKDEILNIPITDFELSVRSRNCLAKMNIRTLGDLVGKTEEELLSYKNFGETSLQEIKDMLNCKGLRLGGEGGPEDEDELIAEAIAAEPEDPGDEDDLLSRSPEELSLSVRCRKCVERLNITTIGELTQITEDELMSVRNFGRTSLEEIKTRLAAHGLSLSDGTQRGD